MVRTFRLETTEKHTGSSAIECSYIRTRTCALDDDDDDSFYYTFPLIALSQSSSRVSPIVDRHDIRYDLIKRTVSSPRKLVSSSHGVSFNVATSLFVRLYEVSIGRMVFSCLVRVASRQAFVSSVLRLNAQRNRWIPWRPAMKETDAIEGNYSANTTNDRTRHYFKRE